MEPTNEEMNEGVKKAEELVVRGVFNLHSNRRFENDIFLMFFFFENIRIL
jgi:hypothetical protein